MVKSIIIGDLHYVDKPKGLMRAQTHAITQICADHPNITRVIFLGDVFMHRRPTPSVLLEVKKLFGLISNGLGKEIHVLRGNHDSMNKSDDGISALSLLQDANTHIHIHTHTDKKLKYRFIPHYEDQARIKADLASTPKGYTVFGHFGYSGVLNSAGDADFDLKLSDFKNPTILGHIHNAGSSKNVSVLGTPYTTNFGEANKDSYYGILEDGVLEKMPCLYGPRHIVMDYDKVEENLDWLNLKEHSSDFTLLRIRVNSLEESQVGLGTLLDKLDVGYVDIKYKPLLDDKEEYVPDVEISSASVTDEMIEHYINSSKTTISKEALLEGLKLIHENQQTTN